jgi:hypothetical protein
LTCDFGVAVCDMSNKVDVLLQRHNIPVFRCRVLEEQKIETLVLLILLLKISLVGLWISSDFVLEGRPFQMLAV